MKILHIVYIGINGGTNIYQKYLNYYNILKKFDDVNYKIIFISPRGYNNFDNIKDIYFIKGKFLNYRFSALRVWENIYTELIKRIEDLQPDNIILRVDIMSKRISKFVEKFNPILEYPTPPIEETTIDKPLYHKMSNKYNLKAMKKVPFNILAYNNGYYKDLNNLYIMHNSVNLDNYKKKKFRQFDGSNISCLLMSSKYGRYEYSGYDRFLIGLEKYLLRNKNIQFKLYIGGTDINGFKEILEFYNLTNVKQYVEIVYLGFIPIKQLNTIIDDIDIGINDLGVHRKNGGKVNALKTLDFMAWGLPSVLAHDDYALDGKTLISKCYLKESFTDEPINIEEVIDFIAVQSSTNIDLLRQETNNMSLRNNLNNLILYMKSENNV